MDIHTLARPRSIGEALELIREKSGVPVAGGVWLKMHPRPLALAVDLSGLGLEYIRETGGGIELGAMTTYRELETSSLLAERFGPAFPEALGRIVGVQLRNMVTVGGTVAGKYGFSDLNTLLMALGARLALAGDGEREIEGFFLDAGDKPPLIEKILLPARGRAAFESMRVSGGDFSVLNAAAAYAGGSWRVALGARPAASRLCREAMRLLGAEPHPAEPQIRAAAKAAQEESSFSGDLRASADYRRTISAVLVERAIKECAK